MWDSTVYVSSIATCTLGLNIVLKVIIFVGGTADCPTDTEALSHHSPPSPSENFYIKPCSCLHACTPTPTCMFRDFKEPCQTVPLAPSMKAPPLINALVSHDLFPQPVVRLEKLDLCKFQLGIS